MHLRTCVNELDRLTISVHSTETEAEQARHNGFCCTTQPLVYGQEVVLFAGRPDKAPVKAKTEESFSVDLDFIPKQKGLKL